MPNAHPFNCTTYKQCRFPPSHLSPACSYAKWTAELYTCSHKLLTLSRGQGTFNALQNTSLLLGVRNSIKAKLGFSMYFILEKSVQLNPESGTGRYVTVFLIFCWLLLGLKNLTYCEFQNTHKSFFLYTYGLNSQLLHVSLVHWLQVQADGFNPQSPTIMLPSQKYLQDSVQNTTW